MSITATHPEDIIIWSEGTYCYRAELYQMNHMSDDYRVAPVDTPEWNQLIEAGEV